MQARIGEKGDFSRPGTFKRCHPIHPTVGIADQFPTEARYKVAEPYGIASQLAAHARSDAAAPYFEGVAAGAAPLPVWLLSVLITLSVMSTRGLTYTAS